MNEFKIKGYQLLENCFTLTCRSNDFLVTFWKLICNHTVTPSWLWMMLKNSPNQGGANSATLAPWHTKSWSRMLVALKAVFLENYFVDSPWILNGYSIECLEKKYQPFSSAGVLFGSWCSIWKPGESNFWVKICLAQERALSDLVFMYCKHRRISCTFWLKILVSNRGCGLSARTSGHHAINLHKLQSKQLKRSCQGWTNEFIIPDLISLHVSIVSSSSDE